VLLLGIEQGHTEYRAVGGDQRQEDAQYLVQHRAGLVHDRFGELHHHGDHQDEGDGAQVFQAERFEQVLVDQVAADRGKRQNERRRQPHAHGGFQLARDTHEGAQAEKLHQHEVVDQHGADQDEGVFGH
jgi:hypothetical protein